MTARYTLRYRTAGGYTVILRNLAWNTLVEIERAQTALGSTGFQRNEQPHNYSQAEIDLLNYQEYSLERK